MHTLVTAQSSTFVRLVVLARPRGAWMIASLPLVGAGFALWERGSTVHPLVVLPRLSALAAVWLIGHAGAMWLNAALDRDRGPVLLGRPVEVPRVAPLAGYVALVASPALAWPLGGVAFACTLACAIASVLYSHPRVALKGRPIGGPLVNGFGYGTLSPVAGWAVMDGVLTWRAVVTLGLAVTFVLGAYFAAQAFQSDEDRRRGYRTLVVTHGPAWTLGVSHACLRVAIGGLLGLALAGVYPRALLATAPLWWWADRHLLAWRGTPAADRAGPLVVRLALAAIATIVAAYADHFWLLAHAQPAGGCGTALVPDALRAFCAGVS